MASIRITVFAIIVMTNLIADPPIPTKKRH